MASTGIQNRQQEMVETLEVLVPEECIKSSLLEGVTLFRTDTSFPRRPTVYEPRIIIMAQGQKTVYVGDEVYVYDPLNYLVLSVPLPIECEAVATPGRPILGLSINVDPVSVGEILLEMDNETVQPESFPRGIYSSLLTEALMDATVRLLEALSSPSESRILGPMIVREIIFRVLCGEHGGALQALAFHNRGFFQIARVLNKIHESFDSELDIKSLAQAAGMSVSTFHSNFRMVTGNSPLQYIKSVRLHRARSLMSQQGLNVQSAAFRVGYESPSQFNREYKRFFGVTPARDAVAL